MIKRIFIDAGHGGDDSGAIGKIIIEKEYNLNIAKEVIKKLNSYNCQVFYSRNDDITVSLDDRVIMSNNNNCDIFVSIHCNHSKDNSANGFESFSYYGENSIQKNIHKEITSKIKIKDRGMKKGNFYVLRKSKAKAVLIECGFISNINECHTLNNNFNVLVDAIVQGIVKELNLTLKTNKSNREVYRVCVGSYALKENSDNMIKQLEKDGYKPYIIKATI